MTKRLGRLAAAGVMAGTAVLTAGGATAGAAHAAPTGAACTNDPQYTVVAREVSVRTQPGGSVSRGALAQGKKFNFRSSDSDRVWFYGYAEGIGFGFVLADGLRHTGTYQNCPGA